MIHLHVGAGYLDSDKKRREGLKGLLDMVENREKIVIHFLKNQEWDLFAVNFAATDQVQHHYWQYMNTDSEFKEAVLKIYNGCSPQSKKQNQLGSLNIIGIFFVSVVFFL